MNFVHSEAAGTAPPHLDSAASVTVVIKALNEERNIARAIESALHALARAEVPRGEVILADSRSSDATVAIATRYPVRIARLADDVARSCGTGPQLGYQYADGDFVCLMDGDMTLDPGFLPAALAFIAEHPQVAGVGGGVRDVNLVNLEFQRRNRRGTVDLKPGPVDRLNGGGLYRRAAITQVGHFSDRNLHGYEEFDLAVRLRHAGWSLQRLPLPFVDHYGHIIGGYALLRRRIRSRYLDGIGEHLRAAIGKPHLRRTLRDLPEIRLWFGVYGGWVLAVGLFVALPGLWKVAALLALVLLPVAAMSVRYRSLPLGLYSFVAWNAHAFGMARGFFSMRQPPEAWIESSLIEGAREATPAPAPAWKAGPGRGTLAAAPALALCIGLALLALALPAPAAAEWVAVRDRSLAIMPGSPLDFSGLAPLEAAGKRGRVVAGPSGNLALASTPEKRLALHCASLAWSPASGSYPDKPAAEAYAKQLRLHGYNIARFHFTDAILMQDRARDFDFDPEQLDRFRYLLAALKRNGIFWIVDGLTSQGGGYGGIPDRWGNEGGLKLGLHLDPRARAHWRRLVEAVLGSVNPYTGVAPLKDPALALVVLANENGVEFASILSEQQSGRPYPPALQAPFNAWLSVRYGSTGALRSAWTSLGRDERLEAASVRLPEQRAEHGPRMRDLQRFFLSLETATVGWMSAEIRQLGYPGLVSAYNNRATTEASLSRADLPVVTADSYHDEVLSLEPGATISQTSSLDGAALYLRWVIGMRWLGRPLVVTEYNHLFWNRFRHEAGLLVPAIAALQGWDAICQHGSGPIDLSFEQPFPHKRAILPYGIALDPIARAGETLAALLFRRGDVARAAHTIALPFGIDSDLLEDGQGILPDDLTRIGLVTGFGLLRKQAPETADRIVLPPLGAHAEPSFAERAAQLRREGVLGPENATDAATGRTQSDTGQLTLDTRARLARLVTPRSVAASYVSVPEPLKIGPLTIESASGPALLAASALDEADLSASRRVLVIFATDAMNTGMTFRDPARRVIDNFGRMPVLIERQSVRLRLTVADPKAWRATTLHLDGARGDALPLRATDRDLEIEIDNARPSHGPTTFFLIERAS